LLAEIDFGFQEGWTALDVELFNSIEELENFAVNAEPRRLRSLLEFAQEEIVMPDGPFKGRRWRLETQPSVALLLREIERHRWIRVMVTAPTQFGKTFATVIVPLLYFLFELGENVILGLPTMDLANDKWEADIKPAILASRYADLLPESGEGSRGGKVKNMVIFRNGAMLKFMSAGGGDEKRSGFTARVLVMTELGKMDEAGEASKEADPVTQMEHRLDAHEGNKLVLGETTQSTSKGRINKEIKGGTNSRVALLCAVCDEWVTPERDCLRGWQDARTELEAFQNSFFCCPRCGGRWSEDQWRAANRKALLVHGRIEVRGEVVFRGQEVVRAEGCELQVADGSRLAGWRIEGGDPPVFTLGFRATAANNLFSSPGALGMREWKAAYDIDQRNAQKEMHQFVWALPYDDEVEEVVELEQEKMLRRCWGPGKGIIPADATHVVVAVDVRKRELHWSALAGRENDSVHVFDYGVRQVKWEQYGGKEAIRMALENLDEELAAGWPVDGDAEEVRSFDEAWVDTGWHPDVVCEFTNHAKGRWNPLKGFGSNRNELRYSRPKSTGSVVKFIGDGFHIALQADTGVLLYEIDVDYWKTQMHLRLGVEIVDGAPGGGTMTLFRVANVYEHLVFVQQLLSEKKVESFEIGRGSFVKWERMAKHNHFLDTVAYGGAALWNAGFRGVPTAAKKSAAPRREEVAVRRAEGWGALGFNFDINAFGVIG